MKLTNSRVQLQALSEHHSDMTTMSVLVQVLVRSGADSRQDAVPRWSVTWSLDPSENDANKKEAAIYLLFYYY